MPRASLFDIGLHGMARAPGFSYDLDADGEDSSSSPSATSLLAPTTNRESQVVGAPYCPRFRYDFCLPRVAT